MKIRANHKLMATIAIMAGLSSIQQLSSQQKNKEYHIKNDMRHLRSGFTSNLFNKKLKNRKRREIAKETKRRMRK